MAESTSGSSQSTSATVSTMQKLIYDLVKLTFISPKLNSKNYLEWAPRIKNLFIIQHVWAVVNGELKKPAKTVSMEERENWELWNAIRLTILVGSVENKEYRSIRNREDVHEA